MRDRLARALAWLRAVATSVVTWALPIFAAVAYIAPEVAELLPGNEDAVTWALRVASWAAVAVSVMRRLTPVAAEQRGVLNREGLVVVTKSVPEGAVVHLGAPGPGPSPIKFLRGGPIGGGTYRGGPTESDAGPYPTGPYPGPPAA